MRKWVAYIIITLLVFFLLHIKKWNKKKTRECKQSLLNITSGLSKVNCEDLYYYFKIGTNHLFLWLWVFLHYYCIIQRVVLYMKFIKRFIFDWMIYRLTFNLMNGKRIYCVFFCCYYRVLSLYLLYFGTERYWWNVRIIEK